MTDLLTNVLRFLRRRTSHRRRSMLRRSRSLLSERSECQTLEVRLLLSATGSDRDTYLVLLDDADTQLATSQAATRADQQAEFLTDVQRFLDEPVELRFDYTNAINAVALLLTDQQADAIAEMSSVASVLKDASSRLQSNSAELTGAAGIWDGTAIGGGIAGTFGEGVLIGIIDSGIDFDNVSFAEVGPNDGYIHQNPFGDGVYVGIGNPSHPDYDPSLPFNNKLVGAWNFTSDAINSSEDADHGTSAAGIAAGNFVTVPVPGTAATSEISGVAPHANIISYDVCTSLDDCSNSAIMAAVDQAIADGVDVINLSIGGGTEDPWDAVMASALLNAHAAGIFVAVSGGNEGPDAATLTAPADAPWVAGVAAVGVDDVARTSISVIGTNDHTSIASIRATPGEGITISETVGPAPVIHAADVSPGDPRGSSAYVSNTFAGSIALIDRGDSLFETKVQHAVDAGAIAVVMINNIDGPNITMAGVDGFSIPSVLISREDGTALRERLQFDPDATLQLNAQVFQESTVVSSFSSRGENPQIDTLAPVIAAPGEDNLILAPVAENGNDRWEYFSGTSAASPHIAGAAALLASLHADWTPAEIQSALQITATSSAEIVEDFSLATSDPFAVGSGLVNVAQAARAGFVLNETAANFTAADPSRGGVPEQLNLPSFVDSGIGSSASWTRTFTSTQATTVTWTPSFVSDHGLTLSLDQSELVLNGGATATFTLTAQVVANSNDWLFGEVVFTPDADLPVARFPVAVQPEPMVGITIIPSGSGTDVSEAGAVDSYEIRLNTVPSQGVMIQVTAPEGLEVSGDGNIFRASLTFSRADDTPQTITVRAIDDELLEGRQTAIVTHAVVSPTANSEYTTATTISDVAVSVFDDDVGPDGNLPQPSIIGPSGVQDTTRPTIEWTPVDGAEAYVVQVALPSSTDDQFWTTTTTETSATPDIDFGIGLYLFKVQAVFPGGALSGFQGSSFQVNLPTVLDALPFYADDVQPTFTWQPVTGAASYRIFVTNSTTQQNGFINTGEITGTAFTPATPLEFGLHRIWVRAIGEDGYPGQWSAPIQYNIGSQLIGPLTPTFDNLPTFSWTEATGAASFEFYLRAPDGTVTNPRGLTQNSWTPASPLANGRYSWWVRGYTAADRPGVWSERGETWIGGRPTLLSPVEPQDAAPEFSWSPVDGAASYEVFLNRVDVASHILRVADLDSAKFTPPILVPGEYALWVRATNSEGAFGPWSSRHNFVITDANGTATATPAELQVISLSSTPTLSWAASADTATVEVHLFNGHTSVRQTGLTGQSWQAPELASGNWTWWARAVDADGIPGPWSEQAVIDTTGRTIALSPTGTAAADAIFSWLPVLNADRYILQVNNLTTGESRVIREDDLQETTFQPAASLAAGTYRFWVRAIEDSNPNEGFWSFAVDFAVV